MRRVALCGTPEFVCKFFEAVYESKDYVVDFVITQSAKKKNRGHDVVQSDVARWAAQKGLRCFEIDKIKNEDHSELEQLLASIDCVLLFAFGKIIPSKWLVLPSMGWLNIHPSSLPLLRGPSPIQYTLLQGMKESALTLMLMDEGMDTGAIIAQHPFAVRENHTSTTLMREICAWGPGWVVQKMNAYLNNEIMPMAQVGEATYSKLINKEDHVVQQSDCVANVLAKIKALGYVYYDDLKIFAARVAEADSVFKIAFADGEIAPIFLQKPGKRVMHVRVYANGAR